jgi:6-pyruvoyltetrahydropterin/6-carboxytetrahydropterin synthase
MFQCKKTYSNIPLAHRVFKHAGDCQFVHGHSWSFTFVFEGKELNEQGFVVDLGGLKELKKFVKQFDHGFVIDIDDPLRLEFEEMQDGQGNLAFNIVLSPYGASSENLAQWLCVVANSILEDMSADAKCVRVEAREDEKNCGVFVAPWFE